MVDRAWYASRRLASARFNSMRHVRTKRGAHNPAARKKELNRILHQLKLESSRVLRRVDEKEHDQVKRDALSNYRNWRKDYREVQSLAKEMEIFPKGKSLPSSNQQRAFASALRKKYGFSHGNWLWSHFRKEFVGFSPSKSSKQKPIRSNSKSFELILPFIQKIKRMVDRRVSPSGQDDALEQVLIDVTKKMGTYNASKLDLEKFVLEKTDLSIRDQLRNFIGRFRDPLRPEPLDELLKDLSPGTKYKLDSAILSTEGLTYPTQLRLDIRNFIRRLIDQQQTAINLHYMEGLTLKEAGKIMNLSESRAAFIVRSALARLRELLEKQGYS